MTTQRSPALVERGLPPCVVEFLDAVIKVCSQDSQTLVSIVLFGSAARGDFTAPVSDVDLVVVLSDSASREVQSHVGAEVCRLEFEHGFRKPLPTRNPLRAFAERTGNGLSSFVCRRNDFLSGDAGRVFHLKPVETFFVDRIVLANVIASSVTVWGEDLLSMVQTRPIRRLDVFKAWFSMSSQVVLSMLLYPMVPEPTRYAMGALKRSLHSCYFCYHLKTVALEEEINFFQTRRRRLQTLAGLLELRRRYRDSFSFSLRCLMVLWRLHLRTALDNTFPLETCR